MKRLTIFLLLLTGRLSAQEVIHLLPGSDLPKLTVYRPAKPHRHGAAVIICPGGAYAYRSDLGEGIIPAKRLAADGITGMVLDYRLPHGNDMLPSHDAFLAICYVRSHHKEFKVKADQIGIMGFSAGGHLAATAGTHFRDAAERPDFMVLAYAVISMNDSLTHAWTKRELLGPHPDTAKVRLYSNELQVTDQTPGAFITHTMDDPGVSYKNSLYFEAALLQHHVPVQLFLYGHGGHAYGIANHSVNVQWIDACITWIKAEGWKK